MILLKDLIVETEQEASKITSKVVFNFYFLWYLSLNNPEVLQTQFGKEISNYYSKKFKEIYVDEFSHLLHVQLQKYVSRKRIDSDFPIDKMNENLSPADLLFLMKKTWRSDMKRRNDSWIMIAEFNDNLSKSNSTKDIFLWVDRCNSAIHNTGTSILGKISYGLVSTYDTIHKQSPQYWKQFVDKDIRDLKDQHEDMTPPEGYDGQIGEGLEKILKGKDHDVYDATHNTTPIPKTDAIGIHPKPMIRVDEPDAKPDKGDGEFPLGALEEGIAPEDRENVAFMSGVKMAMTDKVQNKTRNLNGLPEDFIRGYKTVKQSSWWDKANAKLTSWAADLGNSYGKRF